MPIERVKSILLNAYCGDALRVEDKGIQKVIISSGLTGNRWGKWSIQDVSVISTLAIDKANETVDLKEVIKLTASNSDIIDAEIVVTIIGVSTIFIGNGFRKPLIQVRQTGYICRTIAEISPAINSETNSLILE